MKPTKNRHFCNGCHKVKILFDTKKRAYNFLKFNRQQIFKENGFAPIRSYRCHYCDGWHVTSRPYAKAAEPLVKPVITLPIIKKELPEVEHSIKDFRETLKALELTISDLQTYRRAKNFEHCSPLLRKGFNLLKRAKSYGGRNLRRDMMGKCLVTIDNSLNAEVA
ncbi:MAG: hypothetical protein ACSHXF_07070 [Aquaticitalea sp.]